MSRLNLLIEKGLDGTSPAPRSCSLYGDKLLAEKGLAGTIPIIDEYCKDFDGDCIKSGCPVHPVGETIQCLD